MRDTILSREREREESEGLELLNKPSPMIVDNGPVEEVEKNGRKNRTGMKCWNPFTSSSSHLRKKLSPETLEMEVQLRKFKK